MPPRSPPACALLELVAAQPFGHEADDRLRRRAEFGRVAPRRGRPAIARRLDAPPSACRSRCRNRAPCARARTAPPGSCPRRRAAPKPPGTRMPCTPSSCGAGSALSKISLSIQSSLTLTRVGHAAMGQRLDQRLIGVLEAGVFADDGDRHLAFGIVDALRDVCPSARMSGLGAGSMPKAASTSRRGRPRDRRAARRRSMATSRASITALSRTLQKSASLRRSSRGISRSQRQSRMSRLDADRAQFLDRMLGRLGLELARASG